jgi:hypothetical protein
MSRIDRHVWGGCPYRKRGHGISIALTMCGRRGAMGSSGDPDADGNVPVCLATESRRCAYDPPKGISNGRIGRRSLCRRHVATMHLEAT